MRLGVGGPRLWSRGLQFEGSVVYAKGDVREMLAIQVWNSGRGPARDESLGVVRAWIVFEAVKLDREFV